MAERETRSTMTKRRIWHFGTKAGAVVVVLLLALNLWALSSTDPDFFIPDVFRPISVALLVIFLATGYIRIPWLRRGIRTFSAVVVVAILCLEARFRFEKIDDYDVDISKDVLLRYHFRPGVEMRDRDGAISHINHLGLWDEEHAIPKPADVYRVAVLTGSIANDGGVAYRKRFVRVLERDLAGTIPGKKIETINISCNGYDTLQQVRLLEKVGLKYQPDLVVVAFMATAATIQNGAYRRVGNSFFAFRFLPMLAMLRSGSVCSMYEPLYHAYTYDLIVRHSFERLDLLRKLYGFKVLVASLPVLERFDDPVCMSIYDQIVATARQVGFPAIRVVDAFKGDSYLSYVKPGQRWDLCHPNAAGHAKIAATLAEKIRQMLEAQATKQ